MLILNCHQWQIRVISQTFSFFPSSYHSGICAWSPTRVFFWICVTLCSFSYPHVFLMVMFNYLFLSRVGNCILNSMNSFPISSSWTGSGWSLCGYTALCLVCVTESVTLTILKHNSLSKKKKKKNKKTKESLQSFDMPSSLVSQFNESLETSPVTFQSVLTASRCFVGRTFCDVDAVFRHTASLGDFWDDSVKMNSSCSRKQLQTILTWCCVAVFSIQRRLIVVAQGCACHQCV